MIGDGDCGGIGGMKIGRGNQSIWRKPALAPLCPPQIPHDLDPGLNPGCRGGKPATNRLSYGVAEAPTLLKQTTNRWRQGCQPYAPAALYPQVSQFIKSKQTKVILVNFFIFTFLWNGQNVHRHTIQLSMRKKPQAFKDSEGIFLFHLQNWRMWCHGSSLQQTVLEYPSFF
jgi:hypothetical protein